MRRRWFWPLIVLALAAVVWWAERGNSGGPKRPRVEPVRGTGGPPSGGELRPAPPETTPPPK